MNFSLLRGLQVGSLLLILPLASSTNPAINRSTVSAPVQGPQPDPQIIAQFGLLENPTLQRFIDDKGQKMVAVSDRPGPNYGFTIVDSPVINAFAAPDGHVYFTRGIMAHFNNEAQFAGVLGHEIGHITAQHGKQQQRRSTVASGALLLGSLFSKRVAQLAQPLSQGVGLLFLKYGRDDERESDQLGVKYSTKIGYDASQMADFFTTLQRNEQQSGAAGTPTFLSSHPNSADRYETVKKLAATQKQQAGGAKLAVNRDQYLRLIEGLPYGDDPRQGFVEGGVFYHPDLKFRFPIPSGWKTQNSPEQFQMGEPNGKALLVLLPAPGASLDAAAQALVKQLSLQSAQDTRTTINGFPALAIQANQVAQDQSGQQAVSARVLAHLIQDGNSIFALIGLTSPAAYATYAPQFSRTAKGFARLTEANKLNRQPDRVHIKKATAATTLGAALAANGIPTARREELAVLNGMQLTTKLPAGTLYKVVGK